MLPNEILKKLLCNRIIDISDRVNDSIRTYVRESLQILTAEGSPTVTIQINSGGGEVGCGLDIYDLIKFYSGPTIGIALIGAGSAANTILQACDWRVATQNAHILIHHTKFEITWDVLIDEEKRNKFIESHKKYLNSKEILTKRTSKDLDEIFRACDDNTWISAKEALDFGLLDQIIEKPSDINFPQK